VNDYGKCRYCGHQLEAENIHIEYGAFHRADGRKLTAKHEVVQCPNSGHRYHRELPQQQAR
jgi:hypothetical protein